MNSEKSTFSIRQWSSQWFGALLASILLLLRASWEPFWWLSGLLGNSRRAPNHFKHDSENPLCHQSNPEPAPQEPQRALRSPLREKDNPKEPPSSIQRRLCNNFPAILIGFVRPLSQIERLLDLYDPSRELKDCRVCTTPLAN